MANPYCDVLGIDVPRLERLRGRADVTTFSLFLVALLERGGPMTLIEAAQRFAQAGIAGAADALASLQRCRPGRPPVWRDGDRYALDPHAEELDLRVFMLGLRPPRVQAQPPPREEPDPIPGPKERLAISELDEAWKEENLWSWARQRLVLAVLDAHGQPMPPRDIIAFLSARTSWHGLTDDPAKFKRPRSPIEVLADGRWDIAPFAADALAAARTGVRERLVMRRRWARQRVDPAAIDAARQSYEMQRAARAGELARLRRVIIHAFPQTPRAAVLVDVGSREIATFVGEEIAALPQRLDAYDIIAAIDVRALLRGIGHEPGHRRLADLGPPQKTKQLNRRGRTLKITTELLIRGSCRISLPLGTPAQLRLYLEQGAVTRLRRRLEADAKALFAYYQYGRLHGSVRLRWGFLDEPIAAPWVQRDEPTLRDLKRQALEVGVPLEVVAGSAPGWANPWARAQPCTVHKDPSGWWSHLVGKDGRVIDDADVQLARVVAVMH